MRAGGLRLGAPCSLQDSRIVWLEEQSERRREDKPEEDHRNDQLAMQRTEAQKAPVQQYERTDRDDAEACGGGQVSGAGQLTGGIEAQDGL